MANHALPVTTSTYANFVTELDGRLDDLARGLDPATIGSTPTGLATGSIRWNSATSKWEKFNGTSYADLSASYSININGSVGATTASTGNFTTLTSSSAASLGASSTVGGVAIVTTSDTQTLTNKTLTAPVISSISNTGTLTLPTSTDTLVGRATTDTLTNKTLTAPRFANAGFLADPAGLEYLKFVQTATAVNEISVTNAATGGSPSLSATGDDANISLNLIPKGTGVVQANGVAVVTTTGTQTLTNKTLTTPVISSISNTGTLTLPTSTDTLVGRATADTLTNKTLTAPRFANAGFIADANGNELLEFTTTASAVNQLVLANAAAGNAPTLTTAGTDTNISLNIITKGTGTLKADGVDVATISDTQTLTNKSLSDSTTYFIDETDGTKRLQLQLSGLTTATTITLTPPTASTTIVGTDSNQTLTNKTMSTGSSWAGSTIAVTSGGTGNNAAATQFGVVYGASTTQYTYTAAGTTGQIFAGNTSAAPSWQSFDLSIHAADAAYKKSVRLATTANLPASTFSSNVLTGYSNVVNTTVTTTLGSNVATVASTAGILVGAVISGNANIPAATTVTSITNATTFVMSATATAAASAATTFTQAIGTLTIDGSAVAVNDRILVKDQTEFAGLTASDTAKYNGIYTVTTAGDATTAWVLTRAGDFNTSAEAAGAVVQVNTGTANGGKTFKTYFLSTNNLNTTPMYWNRVIDVAASAAWTVPTTARGIDIDSEPLTVRLNTGNLANLAINAFGIKTIQSLAASTYTNAATLFIAGAPVASTNATITNPYALLVNSGNTYLAGNLTVAGGTITAGNVTTTLLSGNTTTNITIGGGLTSGTFTLGATGSTGAVSLFPATGSQAITLGGATTGTVQIGSTLAAAVQLPTGKTKIGQTFLLQGGAVNVTLPTAGGTLIGGGDTGTVSNTMLANSSVTIGSSGVSLGGTLTTIAGLTSVTSTTFVGALTGAASSNVLKAGDTMTGMLITRSSSGAIAVADQGTAGIDVRGVSASATDAAYMTFHRPSNYAVRFGLDTDNVLKVGGWSMGAVAYKIWHEGNDGSGSGLDADTVDGLQVHTARNNVANQIVRTDGSGYIQAGYINSSSGNEGNNSNPSRVWGTNGSDDYLRTYLTSALSVGSAASATNAAQLGGVAASGYALLTGATFTGDITTYRSAAATTGVIYLGNSGVRYLYYDGSTYILNGANLSINGSTALHAGNYNSYAPTLTGGSASGTWAISISGTAATANALNTGNNYTVTNLTGSAGVYASSGTNGYTSLRVGTASTSGFVEFWAYGGGQRQGYIGASTTNAGPTADTGTIPYVSGTHAFTGAITATGNITAYSSDARLKTNIKPIASALEKLQKIGGYSFDWDLQQCNAVGFKPEQEHEHGVLAQEIKQVLPDVVVPAAFNDKYLTVRYERIVPLLIEAIKEQQHQIDELKQLVLQLVGDNK